MFQCKLAIMEGLKDEKAPFFYQALIEETLLGSRTIWFDPTVSWDIYFGETIASFLMVLHL